MKAIPAPEFATKDQLDSTVETKFKFPPRLEWLKTCDSIKFTDIDFIHAETTQDQAVNLLRFCSYIYEDGCDLEEIAGPENYDTAKLLTQNASCEFKIIELVLYSLTLVLCVAVMIFNLLEVVVIIKHRSLHTVTNKFVISLALSDFLFGFSMLYSTIMNILCAAAELNYNYDQLEAYLNVRSNEILCLLLDGPGLLFASMMASVMTLMTIAGEKYVAIFHPLKYYTLLTNAKILAIVGAIWIVSIIYGLLPLMGWNSFKGVCLFIEKTNYAYLVTWSSVCLISAAITLVIYLKIYITARKHASQIAQRQSMFSMHSGVSHSGVHHNGVKPSTRVGKPSVSAPHRLQRSISAVIDKDLETGPIHRESLRKMKPPLKKSRSAFSLRSVMFHPPAVKAVKTIAIILGAFYFCWMPLLIYFLACDGTYSNFVISWLVLLALLNSLLNPLIYGFRSKPIRAAIKQMCTRHRHVSDCSSLARVLETVPDTQEGPEPVTHEGHEHVTFY